MVERVKLPPDVTSRAKVDGEYPVTEEEKKKYRYGQCVLVPYDASQILDYQKDAQGLLWVKLAEGFTERTDALADAVKDIRVRIVDRKQIRTWEIRSYFVTALPSEMHGFASIPFVLASAFQYENGIGRPSLLVPAEAD